MRWAGPKNTRAGVCGSTMERRRPAATTHADDLARDKLGHELRSLNNDCNLSRPNDDHTCVRVLCTVPLAPIPLFPEHLIELGALARVRARCLVLRAVQAVQAVQAVADS